MAKLLNLDGEILEIPCACGQKLEESIRRLKTNPDLLCPGCGATIHVDADELARGIERTQEALDHLGATLDRLGKRR